MIECPPRPWTADSNDVRPVVNALEQRIACARDWDPSCAFGPPRTLQPLAQAEQTLWFLGMAGSRFVLLEAWIDHESQWGHFPPLRPTCTVRSDPQH